MRGLAGRRALVTGAASGLGAATTRRLAAEGAAVAIADIDADAAHALARELADGGARTLAIAMDVRHDPAVRAGIAHAAQALRGLDVLVNNAGIVRDNRLADMSTEDWDVVLEVNLRGYFLTARAALPFLKESAAARIVNISSRAHLGNPGQANYSAAKAGVIGLTRALSLELGPDGVAVNAIAPGMIDTPLVREHANSKPLVARALKVTPIKRLGTAEDVAAAVAFLASDDAAYISGEVLHVTGGRY
jgi:3-oxoacyl-[acyl-carrier protein] reductase